MKNAPKIKRHLFSKKLITLLATLMLAGLTAGPALAGNSAFTFRLVSSRPDLRPFAFGFATIQSIGPVEVMFITVFGLPPNTDFDLFVIQSPVAPFGLSWYQGDIETNPAGIGFGRFIGRFNIETFIVAPGVPLLPAPTPHGVLDASRNPATPPIHTFHLGLWFNSPADAAKAGFPNTVTPFNGDHHAGVQVLNTSNFPDGAGPLSHITP